MRQCAFTCLLLIGPCLRKVIAVCALITSLLFLSSNRSSAQTAAHLGGVQSTVAVCSSECFGVAADLDGNVYIADTYNNRVLKETLSAGTYVQSVVAIDLNRPYGVAVDNSGNLYIADTFNSQVLKETLSDGVYSSSTLRASGGSFSAYGVAVDQAGNVYIADIGDDEILKETPSGGSYVESVIANGSNNGLSEPRYLAVDINGNVYVSDSGNSRVLKETLANGNYTQSVIATGISLATGIAVDQSGFVYISSSSTAQILEEIPSGGGYTQSVVGATGLTFPYQVAVDGAGNLYIADPQGFGVVEVKLPPAANFGDLLIGSSSQLSLIYVFDAAGAIDAPSVTNQDNEQDFSDRGTGSCDTNGTMLSYNPGDTCSVDLLFDPPSTGSKNGTLTLDSSSGNVIVTTALQGSALTSLPTSPSISFSPAILGFGSQLEGTSSNARFVLLTNTSAQALTVTPTASGDFSESNTCGSNLQPDATCAVAVTFTPTAAGMRSGTLTLTYNGAGTPQTVSLTGTSVVSGPSALVSTTSLTFASYTVGASSPAQTVTLSNPGTATLMLSSISATGDFAVTSNCGSSLAASASCTLSVVFTPSAAGARTGALTISDNASGSPQTIALSGSGIVPLPLATLSAASLTFAPQAEGTTSAPQPLKLMNTGFAALAITSITASGDFSATNTCGSTLAAGATCDISVVFTPTAAGSRSGMLTVNDNASGSPQTVALSGGGAAIAVSSNASSAGLTIASGGGSATAAIQVAPMDGFSGTVDLSCKVNFEGQGTAQSPPTCALSPAQTQISGSSASSSALTITTTGAGSDAELRTLWQGPGLAVAGIMLFWLAPRRRNFFRLAFLLAAISGAVLGCGGSSGGTAPSGNPGTTAGSYQVVVTATFGTEMTTLTIPISVQ